MRRRDVLGILGGAATLPLTARRASAQDRAFRVGLISAAPPTATMLNAFKDGMRERGYVEGQNLSIIARWPKGTFDEDRGVVADLINNKPDVIVAWATPTVIAVRRATPSIPIVMVSVGDPVHSGFVGSLARPGGNTTGVSIVTSDLSAKIVEILLDFLPGMKRAGVVSNSYNPNVALQRQETESALRKLGLQVHIAEARTRPEYERALRALAADKVESVVMLADPTTIEHGQRIAEVAQELRLPTAFQRRENVAAGGLFSYGGSIVDQYRQASLYVDRILKGAKPSDLPVEQPTKFEFVINLKTANALGLTVPPTLLARADEVIE
jgi:putative ABC transport system substrate-binding protein